MDSSTVIKGQNLYWYISHRFPEEFMEKKGRVAKEHHNFKIVSLCVDY